MSETTFHPVAGLFPMMGEAELDENLATSCEVSAEQRKRAWLSLAELASAPDWLHPALAAPVVRRLGERFQIVEGHHRVEAARRAGLEELPCQVVEMGEEEAFMRLRTGNIQRPLRKIEEGRHLAGYLDRHGEGKGGRGQNGGLSKYAEDIGQPRQTLQAGLYAWRVAADLPDFGQVSADDLDAAFSAFKELHAAPKWLRQALATIALGELRDRDGVPFASFEDYCQYPEPEGLGLSPGDVRRILDEPDKSKPVVAVLGKRGGDRKSEGAASDQPNPTVEAL